MLFFEENGCKILKGDCQVEMKELEEGSIDLVLTDPPYHLSNTKPFEERLDKVVRTFNDVMFPDFNKGNIKLRKYS